MELNMNSQILGSVVFSVNLMKKSPIFLTTHAKNLSKNDTNIIFVAQRQRKNLLHFFAVVCVWENAFKVTEETSIIPQIFLQFTFDFHEIYSFAFLGKYYVSSIQLYPIRNIYTVTYSTVEFKDSSWMFLDVRQFLFSRKVKLERRMFHA